jgi:type II secretory pathway component PulC
MQRVTSIFALLLCACAASTASAPRAALRVDSTASSSSSRSPAAPARDADPTLSRAAVHAIVAQGLGAFLQRIELDDRPVLVHGRFHGFRIAGLRDADFWRGIDLRPGDVVTSVNGFPIERPEQAVTVFDSLELASELRVAYDREGQSREIVYSIGDR